MEGMKELKDALIGYQDAWELINGAVEEITQSNGLVLGFSCQGLEFELERLEAHIKSVKKAIRYTKKESV